MSLDKVENLFDGQIDALVLLTIKLYQKGRINDAKGVYERNRLRPSDFRSATIPSKLES
jgi:hypothetical protein